MPGRALSTLLVALLAIAACGDTTDPAGGGETAIPEPTASTTQPRQEPSSTTSAPPTTTIATTRAERTIPSSYADYRNQPTACGATQPAAVEEQSFVAPDDMEIPPDDVITATMSTSCGDIVVELDPGVAPETVNSFTFLAAQGYFDGTVSHRIFPGFVLQAGDPTATGRGGPGYVIPDEFPAEDFLYERGVLAMANAGAGTTGSQFFVMLDDAGLPPQFSVFGRVTAGFDVLDRIAEIPLAPNSLGEVSVPLETLYLEKVTVAGFAD